MNSKTLKIVGEIEKPDNDRPLVQDKGAKFRLSLLIRGC